MPSSHHGFVYVPDETPGALADASAGAIIRLKERRPPWIVVDQSIDSVVVAKWPGKLWHVANVDAEGVEQASKNARYTRAVAVEILGEIPASRLFGEHGAALGSVIERASQLNGAQVQALAQARHPNAAAAYSRAWQTWLAGVGRSSEDPNRDLSGTLAISAAKKCSPVNYGFMVLHQAIWQRAEAIIGPPAFLLDEDGERYLEPTWSSANDALLEAAMALGAPELSPQEDRANLLMSWRTVFGDDLADAD
jgi:hypothetical protein